MSKNVFEENLWKALEKEMTSDESNRKPTKKITAKDISPEIKKAMNLDAFPPDIQNDILALSVKLEKYLYEISQAVSDEEGLPKIVSPKVRVPLEQQTWSKRFIDCWAKTPSKDITKDAWKNAKTVFTKTKGTPIRVPATIGAFGATLLGGTAGQITGCMTRRPMTRRPMTRPFGR